MNEKEQKMDEGILFFFEDMAERTFFVRLCLGLELIFMPKKLARRWKSL